MVNSSIYLSYPLDPEKGNRNSKKSQTQWANWQYVFHKTRIIVTISANYCTHKIDLYKWINTLRATRPIGPHQFSDQDMSPFDDNGEIK